MVAVDLLWLCCVPLQVLVPYRRRLWLQSCILTVPGALVAIYEQALTILAFSVIGSVLCLHGAQAVLLEDWRQSCSCTCQT